MGTEGFRAARVASPEAGTVATQNNLLVNLLQALPTFVTDLSGNSSHKTLSFNLNYEMQARQEKRHKEKQKQRQSKRIEKRVKGPFLCTRCN